MTSLPKVMSSYKGLFQLDCLYGGFEMMERTFERDIDFAFSTLTLQPWK